jgi:hypothetical protein
MTRVASGGDEAPVRIGLITEGTYPCGGGGVSVWCDQLMRGLGNFEFSVLAINLNHQSRPIFEIPDNAVVGMMPLWDPVLERVERSQNGNPATSLGAIRALGSLLLGEPRDPEEELSAFLTVIDRLIIHAHHGDLALGLRFEAMSLAFSRALQESEWLREEYGASLMDIIQLAETFSHLLRPLLVDMGPVDVVHTSAGGLPLLAALKAQALRGAPFTACSCVSATSASITRSRAPS